MIEHAISPNAKSVCSFSRQGGFASVEYKSVGGKCKVKASIFNPKMKHDIPQVSSDILKLWFIWPVLALHVFGPYKSHLEHVPYFSHC